MTHDDTRDPRPEPPTATHATGTGTRTHGPFAAADGAALPVVAGYEILGELGQGGMAVVYRAREVAFDRDVAIKLLHPRYAPDSPGARRFLGEARITGQLQHPVIPPVHHLGTLPDGRPFLAMKLIKGETLAELLDRSASGAADRGRFVAAFAKVCEAVAYAHAHKVIHRDLKPSNVMVGAFGEVQLMDWGLAKVLTGEPEGAEPTETDAEATEIRTQREPDSATQAGSVLGTPAYMSPEQAAGEVDRIDERADVFGLGAVLCVILTGKPPYAGPSSDAVRIKAIRGETADALARLEACGADADLVALCRRCLAIKQEDRPRDADAVTRAVAAHLAAVEERARRAELDRVRAEEQRKRRRTQYLLVGAGLMMMVLAASGAGLVALWRDAEAARREAESTRDQLADEKKLTEAANNQLTEEKKLTEQARDDALRLKGLADLARDDAIKLKTVADDARAAEEAARKRLEGIEYGLTVQVAHQEWHNGNTARARELLDETKPDLRGWEWRYVDYLCNDGLLHTLQAHADDVNAVCLSPDESWVVTASQDGTAKVWVVATGKELFALRGHTDAVTGADFGPDGSRIVTASRDGTAKVWQVLSAEREGFAVGKELPPALKGVAVGDELLTLKGHTDGLYCACFSPGGSRIVTGSRDNTARVWDAKTGAELFTLKGHRSSVYGAHFSPDGSRVVTASEDETAKVWDTRTGKELLTLKGHTHFVHSARFSPNGSRIVTAGRDNTAKVWDAATGKELMTLKGHTHFVRSACFSPDGTRIATGGDDNTARIWNAATGTEVFAFKKHTDTVSCVRFSTDGLRVVTGSWDDTARVWDAKCGKEALAFRSADAVPLGWYQGSRSRVVFPSVDGTAKVWDNDIGADVLTLRGHIDGVTEARFSPDGSRIVTGSSDNTARVWDANTGRELLTLRGHTGTVYAVNFSPDGSRIVTGSLDDTAKVWDAAGGRELFTLTGHTNTVYVACFSPDGSRILTGSWDDSARVWDAKTGALLFTLKGHTDSVRAVCFSPDGSRIATGSGDQTAKVWDARTGAELLTLRGHTGDVNQVSFGPDGSHLVTASSDDGTSRVWNAGPSSRDLLPRPLAPPPRALER